MALSDYAAFSASMMPVIRGFDGSSYVRQEDGLTYNAVIRNLDPSADPGFFAEAGLNTDDTRAILLDDMDPANPLTFGDHVTWPSTASPTTDRYLVVGLPPVDMRNNIAIKKSAVATYDPDKG